MPHAYALQWAIALTISIRETAAFEDRNRTILAQASTNRMASIFVRQKRKPVVDLGTFTGIAQEID
jgi:hypothetical protein